MSILADLRSAAARVSASLHPDVQRYIAALEARVQAHAAWLIAGTVLGGILGYGIRALFK